jgi:hypothetical protein
MGRRVFGDADDREGRGILGEAREVFGHVIEGSDKARSEMVRLLAREVRNYLDELGLKDDLHNLVTNYSLEVHASLNLRRLSEREKAPREEKPGKNAHAEDEEP